MNVNIEDIYSDFLKCEKLALKLASMFPEDTNAWIGTVSERLEYLVNKLIEEKNK